MTLQQLIKLNGKRAMKNKWSPAASIVLILCGAALFFSLLEMFLLAMPGVNFFIDDASGTEVFLKGLLNLPPIVYAIIILCEFLAFTVHSPLSLGRKKWFYTLGAGEETDVSVIFEYFSSFRLLLKSVLLNFVTTMSKAFWGILFLSPASAFLGFTFYYIEKGAQGTELFIARMGIAVGILLLIFSMIMTYIYNLRYFAVPYAFIDEDVRISEALKISKEVVSGHRGELFKLNISLLGYSALSLFILTRLYSEPYLETVRGLYGRYLLQCRAAAQK